MALGKGGIGDETFVGGGAGGGAAGEAGEADAKPENSSDAKRSFESTGGAAFAGAAEAWVKLKFRAFDGARHGGGGAFG